MAQFNERKEVDSRLNTIKRYFRKNETLKNKVIEFENKNLYKIIPHYSSVTYQDNEKLCAILSGVWQEYLTNKFLNNYDDFFINIKQTKRKTDIFRLNRMTGGKSSKEEIQCYNIEREKKSFDDILLCDHQIPLKTPQRDIQKCEYEQNKVNNKGNGKIDIVGYKNDSLVIIEYKIPISTEPLLRAVLEILTYYHQIGGNSIENNNYITEFNNVFGTNVNNIKCAIVVPKDRYYIAHKVAYELIEKFDIACYTFASDDYKDIVRLTDAELAEYKELSKTNMAIFENEDVSKLIVDTLDNCLV